MRLFICLVPVDCSLDSVVFVIHVGGVCGSDSMRLSTPRALVLMAAWSIFGGHSVVASERGGHNVFVSSAPC